MAFDVVTAKQGKPHVTADQQALMQAGMMGKGRYALDALNNLACTMTDSNTLTVDTGGLMVDGRWVVNEAQTSFAIANGSQSQFRKDLAVLEITVDPSTGVTSLEEKVLQGATAATAAAAADPTYEPGDLYTGLTAVVPIARITLDGLTPTCKALLPSVADLNTISEQTKKLGDSVSPKRFSPTIINLSGGELNFFKIGKLAVCNFNGVKLAISVPVRYGVNISRDMPKPPAGYEARGTVSIMMSDLAKIATLSIAVGSDGVMSVVNTGNATVAVGDVFYGSLIYALA